MNNLPTTDELEGALARLDVLRRELDRAHACAQNHRNFDLSDAARWLLSDMRLGIYG